MHGHVNVKNKHNSRTDCIEYWSKKNMGCLWTSSGYSAIFALSNWEKSQKNLWISIDYQAEY